MGQAVLRTRRLVLVPTRGRSRAGGARVPAAAPVLAQGLATEGSRELLRHGFQDRGLQRVFAETMAVNIASRATMASLGMTYVRTSTSGGADPIDGAEQGEVEYEVKRDTWLLDAHR